MTGLFYIEIYNPSIDNAKRGKRQSGTQLGKRNNPLAHKKVKESFLIDRWLLRQKEAVHVDEDGRYCRYPCLAVCLERLRFPL
jgi:hypothetical protein